MPRVSSQKIRQALLMVGEPLEPDFEPERLALFDAQGNPINLSTATNIPPGGTTGQLLAKTADDDYNVGWIDAPIGGGGGTVDPASFATYSELILSDEPLAYWPLVANFDDVVGNRDLTPHGGILAGGDETEAPFDTKSTFFDGIDDRLTTSDAAIKAFMSPPMVSDVFTVELWCRTPVLPPDTYPAGTNGDGPGIGAVGWTPTHEDGSSGSGGGVIMGPFNPFTSKTRMGWSAAILYENVGFNEWSDPIQGVIQGEEWNHMAMIVNPNSGGALQWLNGFWRMIGGALQHANTDHMFIGGYIDQRFFYGQIAHVAVYDRPLGLAELGRHAAWKPGMDVVGGGGSGGGLTADVKMDEKFDVLNSLWVDSNAGSNITDLDINEDGELIVGPGAVDHDFHREDFVVGDATHHVKFMGVSTGALCSLYPKWIDETHWITLQVHRADSAARLYYNNGSGPVQFGSLSYPNPANPMWIIAKMHGDIFSAFIYDVNPTDNANPYSQVSINMRTAINDTIANLFGEGVSAYPGLRFAHFTSAYGTGLSRVDDWIILGPSTDRYDF